MLNFKKIENNLVHKTAVVNWKKITIGVGNIIGPYVVIGSAPQWPGKKSTGRIYIGNKNTFNEYCNIHMPTNLSKKTIIGNNNYFMNSTTIDHDCHIEDNVILSSNVILGGNVYIMQGANLGIKTIVHQDHTIGSYSMIGMGSIITRNKKIEPGYVYYGKNLKKVKINKIGLKKNDISKNILVKEKKRFTNIVNSKKK